MATTVIKQCGSLKQVPVAVTWTQAHNQPLITEVVPAGQIVRFQDRESTFNVVAIGGNSASQVMQTMLDGAQKLCELENLLKSVNPNLKFVFAGMAFNYATSGSNYVVTDYVFDIALRNTSTEQMYFATIFDQVHNALNAVSIHLPTLARNNTRFYTAEFKETPQSFLENNIWYIAGAVLAIGLIVLVISLVWRR